MRDAALELVDVGGAPVAVWRFGTPRRCASTAVLGGGVGLRRWVVNAQVTADYDCREPAVHVAGIAAALGLPPSDGVGLLTAASVRAMAVGRDGGVTCQATVGLHPVGWAAAPDAGWDRTPGTINLVCAVPAPFDDGALVNAIATATEAKVQALLERGVEGTGTATDAVVVTCPAGGDEPYGGPRSAWGARLARAVHAAVGAGIDRDLRPVASR